MKLLNKILFSILVCTLPQAINGQSIEAITFESFDIESGLSASAVSQSIKDKKGFLWIATNNGLNRFDGSNFQVFKHEEDNPNSLSGNNIRALFEDSKGNIWIGTLRNGLNRYDYQAGTFQQYLHDENNANSISSNEILCIYEDKNGQLWVGTEKGLNLFDEKTETFTQFLSNENNVDAISANAVLTIAEDNRGWLWVGTWAGGLNLVIPTNNKKEFKFRAIKMEMDYPTYLASNHVWDMFLDNKGRFWQASFNGGLSLMLPNDNEDMNTFQPQFIHYLDNSYPNDKHNLTSNLGFVLEQAEDGAIWLGTSLGINIFYPDKYFGDLSKVRPNDRNTVPKVAFTKLKHNVFSLDDLPNDDVRDILVDERGILWVSSSGGLSKYDQNSNRFKHYLKVSEGLPINITSIVEEDEKHVWVSTNTGQGLLKYNLETATYISYQHQPNNPNSISSNSISTITKTSEDTIWLATNKGLELFLPKQNRFIPFALKDKDGNPFLLDYVDYIFRDSKNRYWLCTNVGIVLFNQKNGRATIFDQNEGKDFKLPNSDVNTMIEDDEGNLWVTSYGGLFRITDNNGKFQLKIYENESSNPKSICSNRTSVLCIRNGELWIGTEDGLAKYNKKTDDFDNITSGDGLKNPLILGLLVDNDNQLWASSRQGLFSIDMKTKNIRFFDEKDGLQSNTFSYYCAHKGKSNRLYFGGVHGFNAFYGENIVLNKIPPPVFITDFKVFNESKYLGQEITSIDKIRLSYQENYFSIHFSALNFTQSNENQYAYMLEGFDKDWIYSGQRNFANYTNLDGGTYTFKVKAANNDGFWNEAGQEIKIIVEAPYWKQKWFGVLIILSILGISFFIYWWRITRVERKKELLEAEVKARTQEIEKLANQLKEQNLHLEEKVEERTRAIEKANLELQRSNQDLEQFAYAASHDLQEPLRTVGNFVQLLKRRYASKLDDSGRDYIDFTVDGVKRMSVLIKALLEYSRVGRADVSFEAANLEEIIQNKIADLSVLITEKNAKVEAKDLPTSIYCEPTQLGLVFYNLMSNALKFNESKMPRVEARLEKETPSHYIFAVQDNGIGIEEEYQEKIFEVFKRLHNRDQYEGTGVGLASCRRIILRHEGKIWLESEIGTGTTFYFSVSKRLKHN